VRYLVTGATGYIGGRLAPRLLDAEGDGTVRCVVRDPGKLRDVPWAHRAEVVPGDVLDPESMRAACAGVDVVYFLVHSLVEPDFAAIDRRAAHIAAEAARDCGVRRIVYLGGLHPDGPLSPHLASRREVGEILLAGGVPTAALQAAVVLGSGSASFEMLRYLTGRLPVMVTPRRVGSRIQPIAIRDVLRYRSVVTGIGGTRGWYSFPLAWSVRGWLDRLVGGVGLRRGRRDPNRLHTGDALDWWRVERLDTGHGSDGAAANGCFGCAPRCRSPAAPGWRCGCPWRQHLRRHRLAPPPTRGGPAPRAGRASLLVGGRAVPRPGLRRMVRNITRTAARTPDPAPEQVPGM
jgi:uncharacterized protein YbjT (DUF2867 family)